MADAGLRAALPFKLGKTAMVTLPPRRSIVSISVFKSNFDALQAALGVMLPLTPHWVMSNSVVYLWAGPMSWLAIANADVDDFVPHLLGRSQGHAAITDQSDGRIVLQIQGIQVRDALAKLVPIDLHPRVFASNATALTLAGHITVQIWQTAYNVYQISCFRSFAAELYEALIEASREFEVDIPGRG